MTQKHYQLKRYSLSKLLVNSILCELNQQEHQPQHLIQMSKSQEQYLQQHSQDSSGEISTIAMESIIKNI
jgi:hypothetical protein